MYHFAKFDRSVPRLYARQRRRAAVLLAVVWLAQHAAVLRAGEGSRGGVAPSRYLYLWPSLGTDIQTHDAERRGRREKQIKSVLYKL